MKKQNNGITLIALIITIIVLLILAGVIINMVLGENGLINKSKTSVAKYENAQEKENDIVIDYSNKIDSFTRAGTTNTSIKETIFSGEAKTVNQTYSLTKSLSNYDVIVVQVTGYWAPRIDGNYRAFSSIISVSDNPYFYKTKHYVGGSQTNSSNTLYELCYGIMFNDENSFMIEEASTQLNNGGWYEIGITNIYGIKY